MAYMSFDEFMAKIASQLVSAGFIENATQITSQSQADATFKQRWNDYYKNSGTHYNLAIIRNHFNGNRFVWFSIYSDGFLIDNIDLQYHTSGSWNGYIGIRQHCQNYEDYTPEHYYNNYCYSFMYGYWPLYGSYTSQYTGSTYREGYINSSAWTGDLPVYLHMTIGRSAYGSSPTWDGYTEEHALSGLPFYASENVAPNMFYEGMTQVDIINSSNYSVDVICLNQNIEKVEPIPPEPSDDPWAPTEEDFDMQLQIWSNFNKKKNSTKIPATTGDVLSLTLIEPTDIMHPSFVLASTNFTYNYCNFGGRYYFINNIISIDKTHTRYDCDIDVLATWRAAIKSSNAYIERCSWSTAHNILDQLNPPTKSVEVKKNASTSPISTSSVRYYLYISGDTGNKLYCMDQTEFRNFVGAVWGPNITDEKRQLIMNMIVSSFAMKYQMSGTNASTINFGPQLTYNVGSGTCLEIDISSTASENINVGSITLPFPSQDHSISGESYLDHAPYSTGVLFLPGVGCVPLDLDVLGSIRTILITARLSKVNGEIMYEVHAGSSSNSPVISTYSGCLASNVPFSAGGYDAYAKMQATLTMIGGAVAAVGGAALGNPLMTVGGVGAVAGGGLQYAKASEIHAMTGGSLSSSMALDGSNGAYCVAVIATNVPTTWNIEAHKALYGLPYECSGSLNNTGYVKTSGAAVYMAGTEAEKNEVNALLDSGIYIE